MANRKIEPPLWLGSEAKRHFEIHARFMEEINEAAGFEVYDQTDADTLAKMAASHQKAMEYMMAETTTKDQRTAERAQRKRLAEDKNYQALMKLLSLDPEGRADLRKRYGKSGTGFYVRRTNE